MDESLLTLFQVVYDNLPEEGLHDFELISTNFYHILAGLFTFLHENSHSPQQFNTHLQKLYDEANLDLKLMDSDSQTHYDILFNLGDHDDLLKLYHEHQIYETILFNVCEDLDTYQTRMQLGSHYLKLYQKGVEYTHTGLEAFEALREAYEEHEDIYNELEMIFHTREMSVVLLAKQYVELTKPELSEEEVFLELSEVLSSFIPQEPFSLKFLLQYHPASYSTYLNLMEVIDQPDEDILEYVCFLIHHDDITETISYALALAIQEMLPDRLFEDILDECMNMAKNMLHIEEDAYLA